MTIDKASVKRLSGSAIDKILAAEALIQAIRGNCENKADKLNAQREEDELPEIDFGDVEDTVEVVIKKIRDDVAVDVSKLVRGEKTTTAK